MSRSVLAFVLLFTLALSFDVRPAGARADATTTTVRVLVQLKGQPLALDPALKDRSAATLGRYRLDPSAAVTKWYRTALNRYQNQEIDFIRHQSIDLSVDRQFGVLYNGFSATIPRSQLPALRHVANVVMALPQRSFYPMLDRAVSLVNAPGAWTQFGGSDQAGRKEMIADIDTGIDITNPCFSDAGFAAPSFGRRSDTQDNFKYTNNKVIVARAFGPDSTKHYSAADQVGHGTYTGAIEACDANTTTPLGTKISGVAPGAYLLSYNVFPEGEAGTGDSQIISGLEAALLDGADVANLSLGGTAGDPKYDAEVMAVGAAVRAGMPVVVSAGNEGTTPESISSPATAPEAIAVGAVTNSRGLFTSVHINGPDVPSALTAIEAREGSHSFKNTVGPAQMVYVGLGRKPGDDPNNDKADDFAGKDLHGKIAVIKRGTLFFETKINNAAAACAIGAIVFDNQNETDLIGMDVKTATLPAMSIRQDPGNALVDYLKSHPEATATLDPTVTAHDEVPGVLADLSSRGYGTDFAVKPDLSAPGVDVYSAAQTQYPAAEIYDPSGFVSENGTSASAPFVTGAAALILQRHPKWTPTVIKEVLVDTANRNVYANEQKTARPTVMQVGTGLLDVGAAVNSTAYLSPSSLDLGAVNVAGGAAQQDAKLTLNDAGNGTGTWQVSLDPIQGTNGLSITVPSSVQLAAGGQVNVPVHVTAATTTAPGDYDGYIVLSRNGETLHIGYFIHVSSLDIKQGSVLLIDNTTSRYQADPSKPPVTHVDVTRWYTDALTKLGKSYTYWNEATQGIPTASDMKRASYVIYFTGANLNALAAQNTDPGAQIPPLGPTDEEMLRAYMDGGGRLFITGMGAALTAVASDWPAIVLGAVPQSLSLYDNSNNDKDKKGGISPPQPSAVPDTGVGPLKHAGIFVGLKPIDFSTKGDGAGTNVAVNNGVLGLIGVPGMSALNGNYQPEGNAYGQAALKTVDYNNAEGGVDVAVVSSDEPSFKHKGAIYPGRSVMFSFGFEGINNNTGYATREQVLQRIFQWFDDQPRASVSAAGYRAGAKVSLRAALQGPAKAAQYIWQVNGKSLSATAKPTVYRFPHAGSYRLRVQITDVLGHNAVSPVRTVTVH